jgi:hypothetical protein
MPPPTNDLPYLLKARVDALSRMIVAGLAFDRPLQVRKEGGRAAW